MRIGIDLGGTKIESVLLSPDGRTLHRHRRPTPRQADPVAEYAAIC
ncbi:MAG: ROK family protein, partial [Desulfatitalea sp.]|nr:ROK family protein [Desulfatitalea sp.]